MNSFSSRALIKCAGNLRISSCQRIQISKMSSKTSEAASTASYTVQHDREKHQFYINLEGHTALLDYAWIKPHVADLYHTEVPPVFQGRGIAKLLAKAAFEFVVNENHQMKLSCTYLQKYINDNPKPEYLDKVVPLTNS
ncbi:protein NATD1-like [Tubulanus polymorphus]|uniref:protein NATD1-like n=1 Tax=Tubulanus polymorphus TaxID=672921 RepID=UPI003DA22C48